MVLHMQQWMYAMTALTVSTAVLLQILGQPYISGLRESIWMWYMSSLELMVTFGEKQSSHYQILHNST